jgi:hypothetical protein
VRGRQGKRGKKGFPPRKEVGVLTRREEESSKGPPEFPALIEASVCSIP